jgi:GH25 family lysozyme M1 (1,4-beta-N-acetylmuramidase)
MIARGDLAVECGYERLGELREEIMWLCEAASTHHDKKSSLMRPLRSWQKTEQGAADAPVGWRRGAR